VIEQLGDLNGWTMGVAAGVLALIIGAQLIDHRLPGALLALILSIIAVNVLALSSQHGVAVLGPVHGGLPHLALPSPAWSQLHNLIGPVLTVAFVCIAQTAATVRGSSAGESAANDFNRDLIGIGAGSVVAGLAGTLAVDTSPPNSAIAAAAGSRSQLANIMAAAAVLVVALVATGPLTNLPQATLGATLLFVSAKLFRVSELRAVLHFDPLEFTLAIVAMLGVALVGIEQGVALALILSLADRTRRSARPRDAVLGREPGSDHWIPIDIGQPAQQTPGVLVYLLYAPLWYANADHLRHRLRGLVDNAADPVRVLVIDADGISDIDYTGLQALRDLTIELEKQQVRVGIARASHLVHHDLKHGSMLRQLGPDHLFTSVDEAVRILNPDDVTTGTR
jgi:SulP family sulfate permease